MEKHTDVEDRPTAWQQVEKIIMVVAVGVGMLVSAAMILMIVAWVGWINNWWGWFK